MLSVDTKGAVSLQRQIEALALPANKRKKINTMLGREVIKQSRARIRKQRTLTDSSFKSRANGKKKKLLARLMKGKLVKVWAGPNGAKVGWQNARIGKVARANQDGFKEAFNAQKILRQERKSGEPSADENATRAQAKQLVKLGYKRKVGTYKSGNKKGQSRAKRVSQAWIVANMTMGYAGRLIKILGDEETKQIWNVVIPARPFFGLNKAEIKTLGKQIIDDVIDGAKKAR